MNPPIDTSCFQLGALGENDDEVDEEEEERLRSARAEARTFIESFHWAPPIKDILLAFGLTPDLSLFLVRFSRSIFAPGAQGDNEVWVTVGHWTPVYMETDMKAPAQALELYCELLQDWAESVRDGERLEGGYPFPFSATPQNATAALKHVAIVRKHYFTEAGHPDNIALKPL